LIDAADCQSVSCHSWIDTGVAVQMSEHPSANLARFVMCTNHGEEVIHADGNYLNCRQANLHVVNVQEPLMLTLSRECRLLLEQQTSRRGLSVDGYLRELILKAEGIHSTPAPSARL
jgi:hypothetical protein